MIVVGGQKETRAVITTPDRQQCLDQHKMAPCMLTDTAMETWAAFEVQVAGIIATAAAVIAVVAVAGMKITNPSKVDS